MHEERGITLDLEPEEEPTTGDDVFYNTAMVTNRDLSVACLAVLQDEFEEMMVADALSGSGIRGLRYLHEVDAVETVHCNDANPAAVGNIRTNVEANGAENVTVHNQNANQFLTDHYRSFTFVDIDPFGSPAPYLDSTARAVDWEGMVGITATDLGPLYGSYPAVCRRRYAAESLKAPFGHELGLRILIKEAFTTHARHDFALEPCAAWYERHYYRVFAKVRESKKACNRRMEHIGYCSYCGDCGWRGFFPLDDIPSSCPHCTSDVARCGPLWTGKLARHDFMDDVAGWLAGQGYGDARRIASTLRDECDIVTPFYDTHELASRAGAPAPPQDALFDALHEQGYRATPTHFLDQGIRTDAPIDTLHDVLGAL